MLFIAGCAHRPGVGGIKDNDNGPWSGRISLQIQGESPQAFFAGFELQGKAEQGELTLISPIGSVIAMLRWSPQEAVLESGSERTRFSSVDALLAQATGTAVPLHALFDWLAGKNTSLDGWTADLAQRSLGRINAKRVQPEPQTELRIVLDQ